MTRYEAKKIVLSRPLDHGLPSTTGSLTKLAWFLAAERVVRARSRLATLGGRVREGAARVQIGIAINSLAPLVAVGATSVLENAGFDVCQVDHPVVWAKAVGVRRVLVAGCASQQQRRLFKQMREEGPEIPTIALAASPGLSVALLRDGAAVVLPAGIPANWLVVAVEAIEAGLSLAPESAYHGWTSAGIGGHDPNHMTDQEIDWLRILASGVAIGRLADTVGYSERNMKRLLAKVYRKLGASTKTEALVEAARQGLLN